MTLIMLSVISVEESGVFSRESEQGNADDDDDDDDDNVALFLCNQVWQAPRKALGLMGGIYTLLTLG